MAKSSLMRILLIAGSVLIIIGVSLMCWMLSTSDDTNVIKVDLAAGETESIEFENLALIPGESCEYVIKLKRDGANRFDLGLNFEETQEKNLKNFAKVKIISGDEVICDELLATVFENSDIVLPVDFKDDKNTEITIVYYLPYEVGNEAKNAEAIFKLDLVASNE